MTKLCAHFGTCGGCAFQDLSDEVCREQKYRTICEALERVGLDSSSVDLPQMVRPASRRRAALAATMHTGVAQIGFRAQRSHSIVDLRECRVLTPVLVSLVQSFRALVPSLLREGEEAELRLTETEGGVDLMLACPRRSDSKLAAALALWAARKNVARVTVNGRIAFQLGRPEILSSGVTVAIPENAFLQPTREGEVWLQSHVREAIGRAKCVADLFAGCGTFALALARKARVHAVDTDAGSLGALAEAARHGSGLKPMTTESRDLFKLPLQARELARFDAAVLDPPRAGALAQSAALAASRIGCVAYVSCNPQTFARDASVLATSGFSIRWVRPVDQFLWSPHIELVALFERG